MGEGGGQSGAGTGRGSEKTSGWWLSAAPRSGPRVPVFTARVPTAEPGTFQSPRRLTCTRASVTAGALPETLGRGERGQQPCPRKPRDPHQPHPSQSLRCPLSRHRPPPPIPLWPGGGDELARKPRSQRPPPWQAGGLAALVSLSYLGLVPAAQGSAVSPRGSHHLEGRRRAPVSRVCAPMGQKPRDLSCGAGSAGLRRAPAILPLPQTFPNSVCLNVLSWPFSPESQSLASHVWAAHGDGICVVQTIR